MLEVGLIESDLFYKKFHLDLPAIKTRQVLYCANILIPLMIPATGFKSCQEGYFLVWGYLYL